MDNLGRIGDTLPGSELAEKELQKAFRSAALSLTGLFKQGKNASKRAYLAGKREALQDVLEFLQASLDHPMSPSMSGMASSSGSNTGGVGPLNVARLIDYICARQETLAAEEEGEGEDDTEFTNVSNRSTASQPIISSSSAAHSRPSVSFAPNPLPPSQDSSHRQQPPSSVLAVSTSQQPQHHHDRGHTPTVSASSSAPTSPDLNRSHHSFTPSSLPNVSAALPSATSSSISSSSSSLLRAMSSSSVSTTPSSQSPCNPFSQSATTFSFPSGRQFSDTNFYRPSSATTQTPSSSSVVAAAAVAAASSSSPILSHLDQNGTMMVSHAHSHHPASVMLTTIPGGSPITRSQARKERSALHPRKGKSGSNGAALIAPPCSSSIALVETNTSLVGGGGEGVGEVASNGSGIQLDDRHHHHHSNHPHHHHHYHHPLHHSQPHSITGSMKRRWGTVITTSPPSSTSVPVSVPLVLGFSTTTEEQEEDEEKNRSEEFDRQFEMGGGGAAATATAAERMHASGREGEIYHRAMEVEVDEGGGGVSGGEGGGGEQQRAVKRLARSSAGDPNHPFVTAMR